MSMLLQADTVSSGQEREGFSLDFILGPEVHSAVYNGLQWAGHKRSGNNIFPPFIINKNTL